MSERTNHKRAGILIIITLSLLSQGCSQQKQQPDPGPSEIVTNAWRKLVANDLAAYAQYVSFPSKEIEAATIKSLEKEVKAISSNNIHCVALKEFINEDVAIVAVATYCNEEDKGDPEIEPVHCIRKSQRWFMLPYPDNASSAKNSLSDKQVAAFAAPRVLFEGFKTQCEALYNSPDGFAVRYHQIASAPTLSANSKAAPAISFDDFMQSFLAHLEVAFDESEKRMARNEKAVVIRTTLMRPETRYGVTQTSIPLNRQEGKACIVSRHEMVRGREASARLGMHAFDQATTTTVSIAFSPQDGKWRPLTLTDSEGNTIPAGDWFDDPATVWQSAYQKTKQ